MLVLVIETALASCLAPSIEVTLAAQDACLLSTSQVLGVDASELRFENTCGEPVTVAAEGGCDGCTFTRELEAGAVATEVVREADDVAHVFALVVSGDTVHEIVDVQVQGPLETGPCRDSFPPCSTGVRFDLLSWLRP